MDFWASIARAFLAEPEDAERALTAYRLDFNGLLIVPQVLCHIGEAHLDAGRAAEAQRVLAEAGDVMAQHGEVYWEPEVFRLQGRLAILQRSDQLDLAAALHQRALSLAHERGLRLLELRAATDLARLWADVGGRTKARELLAPIYNGFTEGFGAPDLRDAKALLDELEG